MWNVNERVRALAADSGSLTQVAGRGIRAGAWKLLVFTFQRGVLALSCNGDTDEILVEVVSERPPGARPMSGAPWDGLLGACIEYAWALENHRGYVDAFQLRFLNQDRAEPALQFEVLASSIRVYDVAAVPPTR